SASNGKFNNANADTNKPVSADVSLSGTDKANYQLTSNSASTTATINQARLDIYATSDTKTYDGGTSSDKTPTLGANQVQGTDTVDGLSQAFASKNVLGAGQSELDVTGHLIHDGNSGGNYDVHTHTATGTIITRPITVTAVSDNKPYDTTTSSSKTPTVTTGSIATGDTGHFTESFATKTVGTNKTLIPAGSVVDGNSGGNYTVSFANDNTGVITPAGLTVTGITANNKVWNGSTAATLNTGAATLVGVLGTDNVTLSTAGATGTFASSAVGTWTVQISGLTTGGNDAGNYTLTQPTTTASITAWNAAGKGFYAPVGADAAHSLFTPAPGPTPTNLPAGMVWNVAKGGQTIPLKFNIFAGTVEMTGTNAFPGSDLTKAFQTAKLATCLDAAATDSVDYTTTTGQTTLRYDTTGMQWITNWATPKVSQTTCYRTWVNFADGSTLEAFFQLTK
ncbi:MAG TPA: YDG domain-containing protein, partial [Solirubrobacter sp.]